MAARRSWNDRFFDAVALPPLGVALGTALVLAAGFLLLAGATGDIARLRAEHRSFWLHRDIRLPLVLTAMAAFLPAARRRHERVTLENLRALRGPLGLDDAQLAQESRALTELPAANVRRAGLVALAVLPLFAVLIDRDPTLYLHRDYWTSPSAWNWVMGAVATWHLGVLVHAVVSRSLRFSELGRRVVTLDLLELRALAPFARQGLHSALPLLVVLGLFALNLGDRDFGAVLAIIAPVSLGWAAAAVWLAVRGARARILRAKDEELARVNAALRKELTAGLGQAGAEGRGALPVGDLLAWRDFVAGVPELPFDTGARLRFGLYAAIPIFSWLGGALVDRGIGALLR
jgi:hypothetical protein